MLALTTASSNSYCPRRYYVTTLFPTTTSFRLAVERKEDEDGEEESESSTRYSPLEDEGEEWMRIWVKNRSLWDGRRANWSLTGFLIDLRFKMEATSQHI